MPDPTSQMRERTDLLNWCDHRAMPKKKTKRMARRRFKFTGTGKLKRRHAYKGHILTKKTKKRKRKLRQSAMVSHGDRRIRRLLEA